MKKATSTTEAVFTLIPAITAVVIALQPQLTPQQERMFEICLTWPTGIEAVVLMREKAADLFQKKKKDQDEDEDKDKQ